MNELEKIEHAAPAEIRSETGRLIHEAMERGLDPKELYAIYERERQDNRKQAYLAAFSEFQSRIDPVVKGTWRQVDNAGRGFKYATLADIRRHVDPVLRDCGLSLSYGTRVVEGVTYGTVILSHTGGHDEERILPFKAAKPPGASNDAQAIGSGQTYAMRYLTVSILGLYTVDPDDDAQGGQRSTPAGAITDQQYLTLNDLIIEAYGSYEKCGHFLKMMDIKKLAELPANSFDAACKFLTAKIKGAKK